MASVNSRQAVERAAMRRLVEQFGKDVALAAFRVEPPLPMDRRDRAKARRDVEVGLANCTACPLRPTMSHPEPVAPIWSPSGLSRAGRIAIVSEAPDGKDVVRGQLGSGRAVSMIHSVLRDSGITSEQISYMTAVSCWPHEVNESGKMVQRSPSGKESGICRQHVRRMVEAADVDYVLLLGAHALRAWRGDVTLAKVAGRLGLWNNRWFVWAAQHPHAVLRGDSVDVKTWTKGIRDFAEAVTGAVGIEGLATDCAECKAPMLAWDEDGIAWCDKHYDNGRTGRGHVNGGRAKPVDINQGGLW